MGTFHEYWLLADAPVDKNLSEGKIWQKSAKPRRLVRVLLGSTTAVGDVEVDILYGSMKVMHLTNITATGIAIQHPDSAFWHTSKLVLPPGIPLNIIVTNAPTTGLDIFLDLQELTPV